MESIQGQNRLTNSMYLSEQVYIIRWYLSILSTLVTWLLNDTGHKQHYHKVNDQIQREYETISENEESAKLELQPYTEKNVQQLMI